MLNYGQHIQVDYESSTDTSGNVAFIDSSTGFVPRVGEYVSVFDGDTPIIYGKVLDIGTTLRRGKSTTSVVVSVVVKDEGDEDK